MSLNIIRVDATSAWLPNVGMAQKRTGGWFASHSGYADFLDKVPPVVGPCPSAQAAFKQLLALTDKKILWAALCNSCDATGCTSPCSTLGEDE
jgi:hypothetical protein